MECEFKGYEFCHWKKKNGQIVRMCDECGWDKETGRKRNEQRYGKEMTDWMETIPIVGEHSKK